MRYVVFAVAVLGLLVVDANAVQSRRQPKGKRQTVVIEATAFAPAELTVSAGDSVVWVNKDPFPHTATSKAGGFDSREMQPGASWKYVAGKKGDFPYICSLHPTMKGILRVR